jgi:LytS/YehU family sensor histidine kinase
MIQIFCSLANFIFSILIVVSVLIGTCFANGNDQLYSKFFLSFVGIVTACTYSIDTIIIGCVDGYAS